MARAPSHTLPQRRELVRRYFEERPNATKQECAEFLNLTLGQVSCDLRALGIYGVRGRSETKFGGTSQALRNARAAEVPVLKRNARGKPVAPAGTKCACGCGRAVKVWSKGTWWAVSDHVFKKTDGAQDARMAYDTRFNEEMRAESPCGRGFNGPAVSVILGLRKHKAECLKCQAILAKEQLARTKYPAMRKPKSVARRPYDSQRERMLVAVGAA